MSRKTTNVEEVTMNETIETNNDQVSIDEKPRSSGNSKTGKVINTKFARLRKTPSANGQVVATMKFGEKAEILAKIPGFYKVETRDDKRVGYISSNYFEEE